MRDIILSGSSREVAFFNSGSKSGEEHRFINFETEEPIMATVTQCTIKNMQYQKYLVAAEDWPAGFDKLSLQATSNVPNAVWAVVDNGPGTDYTGKAYTLIDLKHGLQLGDMTGYPQPFAGDTSVPKEMPLHVAHEYDKRGKWQQEATSIPTLCRLKNTASESFCTRPTT